MLAFNHVDFTYPGETEKILDGLSFQVQDGEFISILGASGGGKSTLFRLLLLDERIEKAVYPILTVSQTIPVLCIAPIFVLWFGYTTTTRVIVVLLLSVLALIGLSLIKWIDRKWVVWRSEV